MATPEPEYCSHASLIVSGSNLEPAHVSAALRMRPSRAWRRNDNNPALGPSHRYSFGGWKKFLPASVLQYSLDRQLSHWVRRLRSAQLPLPESACAEEFAISCFVHAEATASIILMPSLLGEISGLGIDLRLSVFAAC